MQGSDRRPGFPGMVRRLRNYVCQRSVSTRLPIFLLDGDGKLAANRRRLVLRDMGYYQTKDPIYQELMKQAAEGKATGFIAVSAEF